MGIILAIIIGFIVGLLARAIMPGRNPEGFILTTLLGIGGSLIGKYVGEALGFYRPDQPAGFFMSIVGALIILFIYHIFRDRQSAP